MTSKLAMIAIAAPILLAAQSERPPVQHYGPPGSNLPFSPAVRVGDNLYLSGAIGARPDRSLPEGIEAQTRQAMDNIGAVLSMTGHDFGDVVRCTVMLDNMADWPAFNQVYVTYFQGHPLPARSAFGADGLALGALVEIECQAYAPAAG